MFLKDHDHVLKELDCICPKNTSIFFREQNPFSKNMVHGSLENTTISLRSLSWMKGNQNEH
jgi:hypothetical protein